jgi:hypothetical protein
MLNTMLARRNMNITIQNATPSDADQVAQLWQQLIHSHLQYDSLFDINPSYHPMKALPNTSLKKQIPRV